MHLAYAVGAEGYKVILVELDSNGSLQTFAGIPPAVPEMSLATVLKKNFDGDYPLLPLWAEHAPNVWAIQGGPPLSRTG